MLFFKRTLAGLLLFQTICYAKPNGPDDFFLIRFLPKSFLTRYFKAPSLEKLPDNYISSEIKYGYDLIKDTARYIGPMGSVGQYLGNRMNCSSCHMESGQRLFGGSFATTHGRYPQFRARENIVLSLADRINFCITRPHNGRPLPEDSREMRAMLMYMKWLGEDRALNSRQFGDELMELPYLSRAASPEKGEVVFKKHCVSCHGQDGQGLLSEDKKSFVYPPLWGKESYGIGSSMHRITAAASFIKNNMPLGTTWEKPLLTDEEAYDVAAFINDDRIHDRPKVDVKKDYPNLLEKPIDYPFGPYLDTFTEEEHKFGPYAPIKKRQKEIKKSKGLDSEKSADFNDC